jgi:hypothetical protein
MSTHDPSRSGHAQFAYSANADDDDDDRLDDEEAKIPAVPTTNQVCSRRGCKLGGDGLLECVSPSCRKLIHPECFAKVLGKFPFYQELLDADEVACTKNCFEKYSKNKSARPGWDCDGKNGTGDPNTSLKCLIDWLTTPGNYALKFRGKCKDGKSKNKVALQIANSINKSGVRFPRNAGQVLAKISYLEKQFKAAYDFANSETGAGLEMNDKGSFDDKLHQKCAYYNDLLPHFGDRSSAAPKATSKDNLDSEFDESDDDGPHISEVDGSSDDGVERNNKNQRIRGRGTPGSIGGSISTASSKKRRVNISLMSNRTSGALGSLADAKEALAKAQTKKILREDEILAQNSAIDNERRSIELKLEKISSCEKFVSDHPTWSKEKIIRVVPEFKDVIDAIMDD